MPFDMSHKFDSRGLLHCPVARKAKAAKPKQNGTFVCKLCSRTVKLDAPVTVSNCSEVRR